MESIISQASSKRLSLSVYGVYGSDFYGRLGRQASGKSRQLKTGHKSNAVQLKGHTHYFSVGLDNLVPYVQQQSHGDIGLLEGNHGLVNLSLTLKEAKNGFIRLFLQSTDSLHCPGYRRGKVSGTLLFDLFTASGGDINQVFNPYISHLLFPYFEGLEGHLSCGFEGRHIGFKGPSRYEHVRRFHDKVYVGLA